MSKVQINSKAPDFDLNDLEGNKVSLSSFINTKNVLLVFNRSLS